MSLGKRIVQRRKALGMTQKKLAELISTSQQSLQKIEDGTTKNPRKLLEISQALQCAPEWLRSGLNMETSALEANVTNGPPIKSQFPLISWVQAGAWADIQEISPMDADYYGCPVNCGERTFVLEVKGISMDPEFREGDLIFVDPDTQWENGSFVVARLDDENQATFKQLIIEDGKKFLKAANPDWPQKLIPINGNCTIVGTVIFSGKKRI